MLLSWPKFFLCIICHNLKVLFLLYQPITLNVSTLFHRSKLEFWEIEESILIFVLNFFLLLNYLLIMDVLAQSGCYRKNWNNGVVCYVVRVAPSGMVRCFFLFFYVSQRGRAALFFCCVFRHFSKVGNSQRHSTTRLFQFLR